MNITDNIDVFLIFLVHDICLGSFMIVIESTLLFIFSLQFFTIHSTHIFIIWTINIRSTSTQSSLIHCQCYILC